MTLANVLKAFFPGPLSVLLRVHAFSQENVPLGGAGSSNTVGKRGSGTAGASALYDLYAHISKLNKYVEEL